MMRSSRPAGSGPRATVVSLKECRSKSFDAAGGPIPFAALSEGGGPRAERVVEVGDAPVLGRRGAAVGECVDRRLLRFGAFHAAHELVEGLFGRRGAAVMLLGELGLDGIESGAVPRKPAR